MVCYLVFTIIFTYKILFKHLTEQGLSLSNINYKNQKKRSISTEFSVWSNKIWSNFLGSVTKTPGPQFFLLSLFFKLSPSSFKSIFSKN